MATKRDIEKEDAPKEVKAITPTPEQAKQMFKERKDLAHVMTTEGMKSRYD